MKCQCLNVSEFLLNWFMKQSMKQTARSEILNEIKTINFVYLRVLTEPELVCHSPAPELLYYECTI